MRGEQRVVDLMDGADWIGMPSVVLGELWLGFLGGKKERENGRELAEFLAQPIVEELPVDGQVARIFAEMVHELKRAGRPLPTNDVWIAATAANSGATLLTFDGHFAVVTRLGKLILSPPT